jgi:hypothetical protein
MRALGLIMLLIKRRSDSVLDVGDCLSGTNSSVREPTGDMESQHV